MVAIVVNGELTVLLVEGTEDLIIYISFIFVVLHLNLWFNYVHCSAIEGYILHLLFFCLLIRLLGAAIDHP